MMTRLQQIAAMVEATDPEWRTGNPIDWSNLPNLCAKGNGHLPRLVKRMRRCKEDKRAVPVWEGPRIEERDEDGLEGD